METASNRPYPFERWPLIGTLTRLLRWIQLPGFQGLSLFDLIEIYSLGIIKGALSLFSLFDLVKCFFFFVVVEREA